MPTFTKAILRPGTYLARTPDGRRTKQTITLDRLKSWADKFSQMVASGLRIPAPYRHDPNAVPLLEDQNGADNNAGFWKRLWLGPDATLYGELDVPRSEDASRVGTTVTEVSPLVEPERIDGKGREWKDSITHIALVTHPIASGQENFQPSDQMPAGAAAFCLSHLVEGKVMEFADNPQAPAGTGSQPSEDDSQSRTSTQQMSSPNASNPSMQQVMEALKVIGLTLPDDTVPENLAERIVVAARAISGKEESEGGQEPKEQPTPIVMSHGEKSVGDFLNKVIHVFKPLRKKSKLRTGNKPKIETTTPSDRGIQMSQEEKQALEVAQKAAEQALEFATGQAVQGYEFRIQQLVKTGRIAPKYVDDKIKPQLEAFQLSFDDDGKPVETSLDLLLSSLEALPANSVITTPATGRKNRKVPRGKRAGMMYANEEPLPEDVGGDDQDSTTSPGEGEMTDEQADSIAEEMLKSTGM